MQNQVSTCLPFVRRWESGDNAICDLKYARQTRMKISAVEGKPQPSAGSRTFSEPCLGRAPMRRQNFIAFDARSRRQLSPINYERSRTETPKRDHYEPKAKSEWETFQVAHWLAGPFPRAHTERKRRDENQLARHTQMLRWRNNGSGN